MADTVIGEQPEITSLGEEILKSINDGLFYLDSEWRFAYINKRAANNMGLEPEDLLNLNIWDKFQYIKGTLIETNFRHAMLEQESVHFEMLGILKSRYYQYFVYPVLTGILVYMIDITDRKKAEEDLERSNKKNTDIFSSIQDIFFVLDYDWNFIYVNKPFANIIDKEPENFNGNNFWDMFPKHLGTVFEENVHEAMNKREVRRFNLGGKYTNAGYRMAVFPTEEGITILGIDITDQWKAEEALRLSEEKYRTLFCSMSEGFSLCEVIYDHSGSPIDFRYLEVNKAYEDHTGLNAVDIIGKTLLEIAPDIELTWIEMLAKVAITGESIRTQDYNQSTKKYYETLTFSPQRGKIALLLKDITGQKQMEMALRESEEMLRTVIDNSRDGINMLDLATGRYVFMSPAQVELTGFTPEELNNKSTEEVNERIHPEDRQVSVDQQKLIAEGLDMISTVEYRWKVKSGEYRWFSDSRKLVRDSQEQPVALVGVSRDITERKKLEEELKQQSDLNAAIIEHISDGLFLLDKMNKYTMLNQGGKDFFYQPQNITKLGDSFLHTKYYDMNENELSVVETVVSRALKGEKIQSSRVKAVRPDKTVYYSLSGSPIYDSVGNIVSAIICTRDITEQVHNENMIFQKEEQLETLFENLTDGLYISDKNGNLIMINEEGKRQLYHPDSVKSLRQARNTRQYFDLQGNEITEDRMPGSRAMRGEKVRNERMLLIRPDGEIYISASATPIYDDKGEIVLIAVYSRDITEEINLQKSHEERQLKLLSAEHAKNEALENAIKMKDEFLATITHEFKTPLNVINAALQTIEIKHGGQLSDNINKHLHKIRKNSFRQLRLVNNLLDITCNNAGHLKVELHNLDIIQLTKTIVNSVDLYASQKGIELIYSSEIEHLEMAIDEEKYERCLLNLLSNAIKFTPKDKSIYVHLASKNKKIFISVRDEGIGIPKSKQKLIFERFGQVDSSLSRQAEGTGIGLYLVKALIAGMNGTVIVDSEINKGSTFTITLPITTLRCKIPDLTMDGSQDSRIIQAVAIEFSDHYL